MRTATLFLLGVAWGLVLGWFLIPAFVAMVVS